MITLLMWVQINIFCDNLLVLDPECQNEILQCRLDDACTIEECQEQYLYEEFLKSLD
jgi:hypothetical protein